MLKIIVAAAVAVSVASLDVADAATKKKRQKVAPARARHLLPRARRPRARLGRLGPGRTIATPMKAMAGIFGAAAEWTCSSVPVGRLPTT